MPEPELVVPLPKSMQAAPIATAIRSTTLIMSRRGIKERGYFDDYAKHLSVNSAAALEQAVAGVWLPIELGADHYGACDALHLGFTEQRDIGGMALRRLGGTLMGTMAKNLGSARIVTLWDVLRRYHIFFEGSFNGGGTQVWKVGPKDAILEVLGVPLAGSAYFRHAYEGLLSEGARFFLANSHVNEVSRMRTASSLGFRVAWV